MGKKLLVAFTQVSYALTIELNKIFRLVLHVGPTRTL